ncbi:hypothetical protein KY362_06925 [Candidatus Woesearchaeota archaeon]|nr:hypothetical protein [Candidatus Woesearchaeota archaeon]
MIIPIDRPRCFDDVVYRNLVQTIALDPLHVYGWMTGPEAHRARHFCDPQVGHVTSWGNEQRHALFDFLIEGNQPRNFRIISLDTLETDEFEDIAIDRMVSTAWLWSEYGDKRIEAATTPDHRVEQYIKEVLTEEVFRNLMR